MLVLGVWALVVGLFLLVLLGAWVWMLGTVVKWQEGSALCECKKYSPWVRENGKCGYCGKQVNKC